MDKKYNVGMYGGSFNPLHNGHIKCINRALSLCQELHIIIGDIPNMDDVPASEKVKWFYAVFSNDKNRIILHTLYDDRHAKSEYTIEKWISDSIKIKKMIKKPIDAVFCGSDYKNRADNPYLVCYPDQDLVYLDRDDDGISSSEFKRDVAGHKDWVPEIVYQSYI